MTRWDPSTGKCIDAVDLPVSQVTSCSFGGTNMDELFITSAKQVLIILIEEQPLAGLLFVIRNFGIKGKPP